MSAQRNYPLLLTTIILQFMTLSLSHSHSTITHSNSPTTRPCQPPHHHHYPFCNTSLPHTTRAKSLISLLSLHDKIRQLTNNASSIPHLGIPPYEWWSESLHGIATNGPGVSFAGEIKRATGFPQVIVTAAAFNKSLWAAIGGAVAKEAMAMYNTGQAGLTYWAPNLNIFRDPRWGRGQETPGEDPMVTSAYTIEYVRAFQEANYGKLSNVGDGDGDELQLSACCKHFAAYDLEKWNEFNRYNFNAVVTDQDMLDTYEAPFRSCIRQANASCLMCSYNAVNGIPACANHDLLQKARTEWNFKGYITSDCDAVATIYEDQKYTKTPEDAVAAALKAGTDINCGTYMLRHMKSAIEQGKVLEEDIDKALLNLFVVQLRLGLFDGESRRNKFGQLGPRDVCSLEHRKLALEAALQGIVLLKNEKKLLPLNKRDISSLAIIGPLANSTDLGGGYTGIACHPTTILGGMKEYVKNIYHAVGCQDVPCNSSTHIAKAVSVAKQADYVIVVVGLDLSQENEDHDRYSLLLPGHQAALVTAVAAVSKKPVILVLTGGGPIDISFADSDPRIGSIVWIGYPGETGGMALSDIIFGHFNPGGKTTTVWYYESYTSVPMNDMNMRANLSRNYLGRTYRFFLGDRIYGYGHGLSYTNYSYNLLSAPHKLTLQQPVKARLLRNMLCQTDYGLDYIHVDEMPYCSSLRFQVNISVTNNGNVGGSEVVLLYSKVSKNFTGSPLKQLIGFDRVHTSPYATAETVFHIDPCEHLSIADERGNRILHIGDHILISENIEHTLSIEI